MQTRKMVLMKRRKRTTSRMKKRKMTVKRTNMTKSTKMQQKLKRTTKHSMPGPQVCYSTLVSQATRIPLTQANLATRIPLTQANLVMNTRVVQVAREAVVEVRAGKVVAAAVVAAAFHVAPCFLSLSTQVTQVIRFLTTQANLVMNTQVGVARVAKEVAVVIQVARVAREVGVAAAALDAFLPSWNLSLSIQATQVIRILITQANLATSILASVFQHH